MDYAHARHAGNAGDVFKHVALIAALDALLEAPGPLRYFETHAGDGLYPLGSAGEWGTGVQRVWEARDGLLGRYAEIVRVFSRPGAERPEAYPGSPLLASRLLRPQDSMVLHEIDPQSASVLRRTVAGAEIAQSDGLAALPDAARGSSLVLIDPPYVRKEEWTAVARAAASLGTAPFLLWYPVKALTRPRALVAELAGLGVRGTAVELHWTPLRLKRDRLNGCGLIFSGVPKAALAGFCATLPDLGAALQTHGEWGSVMIGF